MSGVTLSIWEPTLTCQARDPVLFLGSAITSVEAAVAAVLLGAGMGFGMVVTLVAAFAVIARCVKSGHGRDDIVVLIMMI